MFDVSSKYNKSYPSRVAFPYSDMSEMDLIWIGKGTGENPDNIASETISINGCSATYYPSSSDDIGSELIWIDDQNKLVFLITGVLSREGMIRFAESITCTESEW